MANASVTWEFQANRIQRMTKRTAKRAVRASARAGRDYMQKKYGRNFPPASSRGQYPRRRSGDLVRGFKFRDDGDEAVIYNDNEYYGLLAEGTSRMAARKSMADAAHTVGFQRAVSRPLGRVRLLDA